MVLRCNFAHGLKVDQWVLFVKPGGKEGRNRQLRRKTLLLEEKLDDHMRVYPRPKCPSKSFNSV